MITKMMLILFISLIAVAFHLMCPTIQWLQSVRLIQEYQLPLQQPQQQLQQQPCPVSVDGLSSREAATNSMGKVLRHGPMLMPFALLMELD